jgi:cation diffusion facilitator CzcD-associated flavoprotein CzcO
MSNRPEWESLEELDVAVMGAGFSGLYQLYKLRQLGLRVRVFESGSAIGGTWHWNRYPGARVDTASNLYQYSDEGLWREWKFLDQYPSYKEIRDYFAFVDRKWDLSKDIRLNAKITHAEFATKRHQWVISINGSPAVRARFLVTCTGFASRPYTPDIPGLSDFGGIVHHTARWPEEGVDVAGKRVGVLGTGASGVQVIQEIGKVAASVVVFQRTPNTAMPMRQKRFTEEELAESKKSFPERFKTRALTAGGYDFDLQEKSGHNLSDAERREVLEGLWARGGFGYWLGSFKDLMESTVTNRAVYEFWRDKVRARITKPELHEIMAPTEPPHPFGVKRPSLEQDFYEVISQPNVDVVDVKKTPITHITKDAVVTTAGEYPLDVLVLATGFDSITGGLTAVDIHGVDGQTFAEKWAVRVKTHLGVASAEFPNLFFVFGPQGTSGFANGPSCAELQGGWVIDCIDYMYKNNLTRIEAKHEAQDRWPDHLDELCRKSLYPHAESWYLGANIPGKPRQLLGYPGGFSTYLKICEKAAQNGYEGFVLS